MWKNIKRHCQPETLFCWTVLCCCVWILTGCNTRPEGCLDPTAHNFDLEAERPCSMCCTYPNMQLSLTQKWNDRNFSNADTLYDLQGQPYRIRDLRYILSSWSWQDHEGQMYTVDSVFATCAGSPFHFTPDILAIDSRQFLYTLGTIRTSPEIESIRFTLGLTQDYSCLQGDTLFPVSLSLQSPLWNQSIDAVEAMRLVIQRQLESEVLDTLYITTLMDVALPYHEQFVKGLHGRLMLTVNYALWFSEVDIDTLSSFEASILSHVKSGITRTP